MTSPYDGDGPAPSPRRSADPANRRPADSALPPHLDPRGRSGGGAPPPGGPRRPRGAGPGDRPPRKHRRLKWFGLGAGGLLTVVIAFVVIGALLAFAGIVHIPVNFNHVADKATNDLNILVVGSDSRAGLTKAQQTELHVGHDAGQRTDTMLLVHIPAGNGKAVIVSLPRDSYVTIPAHTTDGHHYPAAKGKLNAAFAEGGANLLTQTVEQSTGVHLDHYIQINFTGFVHMVDAVGGVTVCTATPIHDPVRRNPSGTGFIGSGLNLPAGKTTVDGVRALEYVRAREFDPTEDLGRMRRQQEFIADLIHKVESLGVLANPLKLHSLIDAVAASLKVDSGLGSLSLFHLALRLRSISAGKVQELTVPLANPENPSKIETIDGVGQSVVVWDPHLSKVLFSDLENDKPVDNLVSSHKVPIAPSNVALKVLNATTTNGLAAKAASDLSSRGFQISGTGNAPKGSDPAKTVVRYGSGRAQSAQTVAASVPGATRQLDRALGAQGLELVVGSNFKGTVAVKVATNAPAVHTAAGQQCQTA